MKTNNQYPRFTVQRKQEELGEVLVVVDTHVLGPQGQHEMGYCPTLGDAQTIARALNRMYGEPEE